MAPNYEKLMHKTHCGPEAVAWLKTALDPFHDYDVSIAGIPDNDSQPSVVQVIPITTTLTAPPNLSVGETWSAQIVTLPLTNTVMGGSFFAIDEGAPTGQGARRSQDGSQFYNLGTVTVVRHGDNVSGQHNQAWSHSLSEAEENTFGDPARVSDAFSIDTGGTKGIKKLIAGGFEVHNDTAALYKQGSVTAFSASQFVAPLSVGFVANGTAAALDTTASRSFRQPPANRQEAASHPSSRTWEAAEGCYVPIRLGDTTHYQGAQSAVYHHARHNQLFDSNCGFQQNMESFGVPYTGSFVGRFRHADIEMTGAYFSGLSQETVLTLTIKFVVEIAPSASDAQLMYMMSPTPEYCPKAIEMYHAAVRSLPPGVPVNMNNKGDWYRMVTKALDAAAPVILPLVAAASPSAAAIASAALSANSAVAQATKPKQKKAQKPAAKTKTAQSKATSKPNRGNPARMAL